jgi:hypothetical protein
MIGGILSDSIWPISLRFITLTICETAILPTKPTSGNPVIATGLLNLDLPVSMIFKLILITFGSSVSPDAPHFIEVLKFSNFF